MKRLLTNSCVLAFALLLTGCCCGMHGGGGYPTYYGPSYGQGGGCANGSCGTGVAPGGYYPQGASLYGTQPAIQAGISSPAPVASAPGSYVSGYAPQQAFVPFQPFPRY